ncbi:MAG: tetratricopeptide repeat protein [Myxococcales bacterium]|nr:tetratricopeptide repeat protein [Myxococcales bacterium]
MPSAFAQAEDDLREGDKYFEEGDFRRAARAYDAAIRKYPGQVSAEAYGKRAAIYIILKDFEGGLTFVRKVAKAQHAEAPEILEQEALLLWQLGQKPDAVAIAERVVARKPRSFLNQNMIGEYYANRDPGKTIAAYEAYLDARPSELEGNDVLPRIRLGFAYLGRARAQLRDGKSKDAGADYDKAVAQLETVQRKFGKRANAMVNADNGLCAGYTGQAQFDRAIAVCERVVADPRKVDANGSVWFNLGVAYLAKKQPQRARAAALEFLKRKKNEARGFILTGDAYFQEKDWAAALDNYLKAEKLLRAGQQREQVSLSVQLGKTYRRLPFSGAGQNPNLALAIEKLKAGIAANPGSYELATELGGAYLAAREDATALTTVDRLIGGKDFATASTDDQVGVVLVSAKAQYNLGKLGVARQRFEAAAQLRPKDSQVQRALVETINAQAWAALAKDERAAQAFLDEAAGVDPRSPMTALNMAVLAIDRGDCDGAQRHLNKLEGNRRGYAMGYERLLARTYLCAKKPDAAKAAEHYAAAEAEAKKNQANLVVAEVYTEWAPLLFATDLDDAVEKLTVAVQFSAQVPEVATAAKRNLAVALFRRGWRSIKAGKASEAVADFERATREPALLKGTEPPAFQFSYALALLEKGDNGAAASIFKELAGKGNQGAYLRPPYNKVGSQFFGAYASYRSNNAAARQKAAGEFGQLQGGASGAFAQKVRELIASSWEFVAYDHWKSGRTGPADKALQTAVKFADDDIRRRVTMNRAVLSLGKDQLRTLEDLNGQPAEALVNLGIVYEQLGRPKDAYDAWSKAKQRGVSSRDLQKWIDAKKRIYGY